MITCPVCKSNDIERKVELIWCSTYYNVTYKCKDCGAVFTPKMLLRQWERRDYIGSLPIIDQTIQKNPHITLSHIQKKKQRKSFKTEYHG